MNAAAMLPIELAGSALVDLTSPEFKRWFGSSKIVDADNNPLPVFHGGDVITEFDLERTREGGFYFTADEWLAHQFMSKGGAVTSVYLSIQNPKYIQATQVGCYEDNGDGFEYFSHDEAAKAAEIALAKTEGYDGLVIENLPEGGEDFEPSTQYVAFSATQIKSATHNTGLFSGDNPDIYDRPRRPKP